MESGFDQRLLGREAVREATFGHTCGIGHGLHRDCGKALLDGDPCCCVIKQRTTDKPGLFPARVATWHYHQVANARSPALAAGTPGQDMLSKTDAQTKATSAEIAVTVLIDKRNQGLRQ